MSRGARIPVQVSVNLEPDLLTATCSRLPREVRTLALWKHEEDTSWTSGKSGYLEGVKLN